MKGMYADETAYASMVENDPLVYEFHDLGLPSEGAIAFGTSIIYAGKVAMST